MKTETHFNSGGFQLRGNLFIPEEPQDTNGVLFIHGSAQNGKAGDVFSDWQQRLVAQGIGSFAYDSRGTGNSGGEFRQSTLNNRLEDSENALDLLTKKLGHTNISVVGFSMGAHVAIRLMEKRPDLARLVLIGAVVYSEEAEDKELGEPFSTVIRVPNKWHDSKVLRVLNQIQNLSLLVYGQQDFIGEDVRGKIRDWMPTSSSYREIRGGGHNMFKSSTSEEQAIATDLYSTIESFFDKN